MNPYESIENPRMGEWGIMGIGDRNRSSGVLPVGVDNKTNNLGNLACSREDDRTHRGSADTSHDDGKRALGRIWNRVLCQGRQEG